MPTVHVDRAPDSTDDDALPPASRTSIASVMVLATYRLGRPLLLPVTFAAVLTSC